MSLLHQDTPDEIDDAAKGEEFTKGSSHVVLASVIAAIVVSVSIAAFLIAGEKPPMATGEILQVWAHPMHVETSGLDANGAPMAKQSFDQVLVFSQVRLHNQSKDPLFLHQVITNAVLSGGIRSSYAASAPDFDRTFVVYPELQIAHGKALPTDLTLDPGQTVEGEIVSAFKMSKQEWESRKGLNLTFGFRYQPNLVLESKTAAIEQ
jgi:hypothetical protein